MNQEYTRGCAYWYQVAGQAVGAVGQEKADNRADNAIDKVMKAENKAGIISGMAPSDVMEKYCRSMEICFNR